MSHIVTIKTEVRDAAAAAAACRRLKLPAPSHDTFQLFSREVAGLGIHLPDWRYPAVCDLANGQVCYDNFNGRWGEQRHLEAFIQAYSVEKTKIESRRQGHSVTEQQLEDGSIKLTVNVGGAQ